jgi:hypothetical protein
MKRKIAGTKADPTLPKTPIVIGGKTYNLCFDLGALAEAETSINAELAADRRSERVNLLAAMPVQNLRNTRILFAAAVRTFHPQLSFDEALALPRLNNMYEVGTMLIEAWTAAMVDPDSPANPPQPEA